MQTVTIDSKTSAPADAGRCPLCGGDNRCGVVQARAQDGAAAQRAPTDCWCMQTAIPASLRAQVPPGQCGSCICAACVAAAQAAAQPDTP